MSGSESAPPELPAWDLYLRDHCGLCDQALGLLAAVGFPALRLVWIDHEPALEQAYGERIPVLSHGPSGTELDWPFTATCLQRLRERVGDPALPGA